MKCDKCGAVWGVCEHYWQKHDDVFYGRQIELTPLDVFCLADADAIAAAMEQQRANEERRAKYLLANFGGKESGEG